MSNGTLETISDLTEATDVSAEAIFPPNIPPPALIEFVSPPANDTTLNGKIECNWQGGKE